MAEYKLGKICPIFRGNWSSNETYDRLDVVTHNLISYVSLVTDNESEPSLSNQNWQLVAKGATTQDVIAALRGSNLQAGEIVAQSIEADEITVDGKDVATEEYVGNYTKYAIDSIDIDQTGTTQVNVEYTFTGGGGGAVNILPATSTRAGAMSAADKTKLDSISPQGDHPVEVEADGNGDLDVSDDAGYVIGRFENGHIRTKNFYSGNIYTKSEVDNLIGSGGVTPQQLQDGLDTKQDTLVSGTNIKTINNTSLLGSGNISIYNPLSKFTGKKFAVIGDSISTFSGWLPSDVSGYDGTSYAVYYPHGNVSSANDTWWYKTLQTLGITPTTSNINVCAWSGSKVTGNSSSTTSASAACSNKRISDLAIRGWNPDIIITFISCNDWAGNISIGNWQISDAIPTDGTISELRAAYALMLNKIQMSYPNARIFCCTILDDYKRDKTTGWPSNNTGGVTTKQWNDNIKEIAEAFGCDVIDLHNCGVNYANIASMAVDEGLHPNSAGMTLMAQKVANDLISKY